MEAATAVQSRLIGAILVEKNLITGEQLERALQLQEETGERLGEVVVAQFGVPRLELASVLAEQWAELEKAEREAAKVVEPPVAAADPLTPAEVQIRRPLGEIFVELGFISSGQLDAALDKQRETGARIGEILVEQGSLTRLDLASALAEQWSALQKLRPPAPVADPQPWQNGLPETSPAGHESQADDRAVLATFEERLRVVERAASATPWQEDLRLVTSDLRAAVRAVEERLETRAPGSAEAEIEAVLGVVNGRIEALEGASVNTELAALRQELDELRTQPVTEEGLADLRAAIERLEGRPDRAEEISQLSAEIAGLTSRFDGLAAVGELANKLDAVAGQAEVAQTGIAGLSRRVDDLAGLERRLEEIAARLPGDDVIEELRRALTDLATQAGTDDRSDQGADIASLVARLDQVGAQVEDVAATRAPDLTPRIDDLSARVAEMAAAIPAIEAEGLATRIASLEEEGRAGSGALELLAAELDELESRTEARLAGLATREPDMSPVVELRARVDDLAAAIEREPGSAPLDELRGRLDELAAAVARGPDARELDGVRFRLDELAEAVQRVQDPAPVAELRARVDDLAAAIEREPGSAPLDELRGRLDELAAAVARGPDARELDGVRFRLDELAEAVQRVQDPAPVAELRARVDDLAAVIEREPGSAPLDELRGRLDELAAAVARGPDARELDGVRFRLDELAEAVQRVQDPAPVAELRARVDDLAAAIEREPGSAPLDEIRARLDGLTAALERGPDLAPVDELRVRVDDLAAAVERGQDATPLEGVRGRLDELAAALARKPDTAPLDEIRGRLDELAAALERDESVSTLEARVGELEQRLAVATPAAELREEMRRVVESTVVERESLAQALYARVEEITATVPREDELLELRSRLEELAARPTGDRALQARVGEIAARLEGLGAAEGAIADLRESLAEVDGARAGDAFETGARLSRLEAAIDSIAGLEARIREGDDLADRSRLLAARLDGTESRLVAVELLEESVSELAAELERRPDSNALAELAAELRAELEVIADRPTIDDPSERLQELSRRIDHVVRDAYDRSGGLAENLNQRIGELAEEVRRQVDEIAARAEGLVSREEAAATTAEQAEWIRAELEALRRSAEAQAAAVDASLAEADRARAQGLQELQDSVDDAVGAVRSDLNAREAALGASLADQIGAIRTELGEREAGVTRRLDDAVGAIRADLDEQGQRFGFQLQAQWNEAATLRARVDELQGAAADRTAWETRFESMLEQRLEGLALRITDEVAGARLGAEEATAAVREEMGSLGARIDEMFTLRHSDVQTARTASERLAERVEALAGLRADDAEAARAAAADLSARLESLAGSLHAEAASAHAAADRLAVQVGAQIGELQGLRVDDLAAVELAGAELGARLDDHAQRSAEAAFEVEQALRDEIGGVAARLEERDVEGIEAREELRGELERVASSVGWRLERIEESLASEDVAELKASVTELERRLEGQVAMGEEQVRATERALRKGLASLGGRLVDSESAYVEAGNALRRSIERLGAAVVEADARMADQIPVSEAEGCVAFAPTAAGYRLVELPGRPPELGSTVELEVCDGPLVVTRYGRSPLPLDSRPCAYLDRA